MNIYIDIFWLEMHNSSLKSLRIWVAFFSLCFDSIWPWISDWLPRTCCTVLYILCCTVLYCTVLHCTVPFWYCARSFPTPPALSDLTSLHRTYRSPVCFSRIDIVHSSHPGPGFFYCTCIQFSQSRLHLMTFHTYGYSWKRSPHLWTIRPYLPMQPNFGEWDYIFWWPFQAQIFLKKESSLIQ
jgi:hypothetical protein